MADGYKPPYRGTHHLGGYHSQEEFLEDLLGRGAGDPDHHGNPDEDRYDQFMKPQLPPSKDGIYPRCVHCNNEIYAPAVIEYSRGTALCYICSHKLPAEYIKLDEGK